MNGNVGIGTTSSSYPLHVDGTAAATLFDTLSDIRRKQNIKPLQAGLKEVEQLKPVTFEWKDLPPNRWKNPKGIPTDRAKDTGIEGQQIGFIAQDVEKILPSVVLTEDNAEKTKGMKYNEIIPVLTKAIQELKANNVEVGSARECGRSNDGSHEG